MNELQKIIRTIRDEQADGGCSVLASVVDVRGSTYRRRGARMLVTESGKVCGTVSGGCLEKDVVRRAMQVMHTGRPCNTVYESNADDDPTEGFALGCNGSVEILIQKVGKESVSVDFLERCLTSRKAGVLATVFATDGTVDADLAACVVLSSDDGPVVSGIRDPSLAERVTSAAVEVLSTRRSFTAAYEVACGTAYVFIEYITPPVSIVIFGAGHDAIPLAQFAKAIGWRVTLVDRRPGYATRTRFPEVDEIVVADPEVAPSRIGMSDDAFSVVMNHNIYEDMKALKFLLSKAPRYIGILGPKKRTERLLGDLADAGIVPDECQLARMYGPVGLDIGADTPEEVALAILAEIRAVLSEREGGYSRNRANPLHERTSSVRVSKAVVCDVMCGLGQ